MDIGLAADAIGVQGRFSSAGTGLGGLSLVADQVYNIQMQSNKTNDVLDRLLEPVVSCLNREAARKIIALRADAQAQARIDQLAVKCNEGQLSPAELAEYQRYIAAGSLVAILKAQAQLILADSRNT